MRERREQRSPTMIDIHIRISRRLVLWVVVLLVLGVVIPWAFAMNGHGSGGLQVGPVQTQRAP
jgi:hypothetical protein